VGDVALHRDQTTRNEAPLHHDQTTRKAPARSTVRASLRSSLPSVAAVLTSSGTGRAAGPFQSHPVPAVEARDGPALPRVARASLRSATRSRPLDWSANRFRAKEARERLPVEAASSGGASLPRANGEAVSVSERAGTLRRSRGEVWGH
jgi:hypothetical protein